LPAAAREHVDCSKLVWRQDNETRKQLEVRRTFGQDERKKELAAFIDMITDKMSRIGRYRDLVRPRMRMLARVAELLQEVDPPSNDEARRALEDLSAFAAEFGRVDAELGRVIESCSKENINATFKLDCYRDCGLKCPDCDYRRSFDDFKRTHDRLFEDLRDIGIRLVAFRAEAAGKPIPVEDFKVPTKLKLAIDALHINDVLMEGVELAHLIRHGRHVPQLAEAGQVHHISKGALVGQAGGLALTAAHVVYTHLTIKKIEESVAKIERTHADRLTSLILPSYAEYVRRGELSYKQLGKLVAEHPAIKTLPGSERRPAFIELSILLQLLRRETP
jgi:hypothetical protein